MADKRGSWAKPERNLIWKDYIDNKMWIRFDKNSLLNLEWDWKQKAPCPICGTLMLKAQYEGFQSGQPGSWNIDHWDNNPKNNNLMNLFPMHTTCNNKKSNG